MSKELIECAAKAMALHAGWEKWEAAKNFCDTPGGNDPEDERQYWIDLATIALNQAAANKAAEEGELPKFTPLPEPRKWVSVRRNATSGVEGFDAADDYFTGDQLRQAQIEYARAAIAADRASRHVASVPDAFANKAEVEPIGYMRFRAAQSYDGRGDIDYNEWFEQCAPDELGDDKLPAFPVYATPPATTCASTVLTDERKPLGYARFRAAQRITTDGDVDANEWYEFCEPHDIGDDKLPAFPVYDEPVREVAAQAGQVAVPEHPQFDASKGIYWFSILLKCSALLEVPDDEPIPSGVLKAVQQLVSERAAPSPAKESK